MSPSELSAPPEEFVDGVIELEEDAAGADPFFQAGDPQLVPDLGAHASQPQRDPWLVEGIAELGQYLGARRIDVGYRFQVEHNRCDLQLGRLRMAEQVVPKSSGVGGMG